MTVCSQGTRKGSEQSSGQCPQFMIMLDGEDSLTQGEVNEAEGGTLVKSEETANDNKP